MKEIIEEYGISFAFILVGSVICFMLQEVLNALAA